MKIRFLHSCPAPEQIDQSILIDDLAIGLEQFLKSKETAPVNIQFDASPANLSPLAVDQKGTQYVLSAILHHGMAF